EIRLAVRTALADLTDGATVIVALSGGADSLALAAATVFEARSRGMHVVSSTIDHGLQEGSAEIAASAAAKAERLGIRSLVTRVDVSPSEGGLEAAARDARYAALRGIVASERADAVLLGHTLDDQAETVLLGLARGAGATSLQ